MDEICYYCGKPKETDEHVPPKSFFPKGQRKNLIVVPSCKKHNHGNANDIEYVVNIVRMSKGVNESGGKLAEEITVNSLNSNLDLLNFTFKDSKKLNIKEEFSRGVIPDTEKFFIVMNCIFRGLIFHDTHTISKGSWRIILDGNLDNSKNDNLKAEVNRLRSLSLVKRKVENPEAFQYYCARFSGIDIYKLVFYENTTIWGQNLPD